MIPNFVLYIKKESLLKAALAYVEELRDHHMPMLRAADLHELRLAHETANMIINAEMKLKASLMRKESRCSHYRLDYPEPDTKNWNAWINIYKGNDGNMNSKNSPLTAGRRDRDGDRRGHTGHLAPSSRPDRRKVHQALPAWRRQQMTRKN